MRLSSVLQPFPVVAAALMVLTGQTPTIGAEREVYTPGALRAAQQAGKSIIVHVTAPWCGTCAAQVPIILSLLRQPKYKDLVLVMVDFDRQKAALRELDVRAQSTFVAFKGRRELGRTTGVTDPAEIEKLFDKVL